MASRREELRPRTFFLNESHELSSVDKEGGGRLPEYVGISWARKAKRISSSIERVIEQVASSSDPLRDERFFVLAKPVETVEKKSADKRKAPQGTFQESTSFGGPHGRVFDRLDLDLLQVTDAGQAIVHGTKERVSQLLERSRSLDELGAREQARWVTIEEFGTIPPELRVDGDWLSGLRVDQASDVVFELQPVLGRVDADRVLRAIADLLRRAGEKLTGTGTDYSGRYWFRGKAAKSSVRTVAKDFQSVQSIHAPLFSYPSASRRLNRPGMQGPARSVSAEEARTLPCVAVLDLGVPVDHVQLAPYRRGQFTPQGAGQSDYDHGAFVASRVVFGDWPTANELDEAAGRCSYYDVVIADGYEDRINDKLVMDAMSGVRGAAPDVRVFNLSFGDRRPMADFPEVEQREKRLLLQDLDNFVFGNDVLVVVAAGNSQEGVAPNPAYPNHYTDLRWALGPWACGFNTLVCGAYVSEISAAGLVKSVGWPSPFTRIGPGLTSSPVPSFCAPGGNCNEAHNGAIGLGVWGFSGSGMAEDRMGTSHAAPLLAREGALALSILQQYCAPGIHPFAITVRAFLALTAKRTTDDASIGALVTRTLGLGRASSDRLHIPISGSAVILWQGTIEAPTDVLRVQLPIPADWLGQAAAPILRLFVCYDPPVNEAAKAIWACRRVRVTLHPGPDARGIKGAAPSHESYPLYLREFRLKQYGPGEERAAEGDLWVLELQYDEIFDYPPGMDFDPRQRVAFAAELVDLGNSPIDPQPAVQALPSAAAMNRFSIQASRVRTPVIVRRKV